MRIWEWEAYSGTTSTALKKERTGAGQPRLNLKQNVRIGGGGGGLLGCKEILDS